MADSTYRACAGCDEPCGCPLTTVPAVEPCAVEARLPVCPRGPEDRLCLVCPVTL